MLALIHHYCTYTVFMIYLGIFIKLAIGVISILLYLNISGRTQLSQMNALDIIANFILGAVVGDVLLDPEISLHKYIIVLIMAVVLLLILQWGMLKSDRLHAFVIGKPIPIIKNGRFLMDKITENKSRVDLMNVASQLNRQGILSFDDIYFAQIEPSGDVTAICDKNRLPAKIVIYQGIFRQVGLDDIEMTQEQVLARLKRFGVDDISDVFLCEYKNDAFQCITNEGSVYPPRDWRQARDNKRNEERMEQEEAAAEKKKESSPEAAVHKIVTKLTGEKKD